MVKCPFRSSFNPLDGTWLSITDYSNDLQTCINAAVSAGKNVYLPAGTYTIGSTVDLASNVIIRGVGDTSILNGTSTEEYDSMLSATGTTGATLKNLKLTTSVSSNLHGLTGTGTTNLALQGVTAIGTFYMCVKLGSGTTTTGLAVTDSYFETTRATSASTPWFTANIATATFTNTTFKGPGLIAYPGRCFYVERECNNITWTNCTFTNGNLGNWQCYIEGATGGSGLTLTNCVFNATHQAVYGHVSYSNVLFDGCTFNGPNDYYQVEFGYNPTGWEFDGCDFLSGGADFVVCFAGPPYNYPPYDAGHTVLFHDGTWDQVVDYAPSTEKTFVTWTNMTAV